MQALSAAFMLPAGTRLGHVDCTVARLRCLLLIVRPDELRDAFRALADRLLASANQPAPAR
jgi:hypothetical protein